MNNGALYGVIFLVLALFIFLTRSRLAEGLHKYQSIYQPTGPWWRNGAWRPSLRTTRYMADAFAALMCILALLSISGIVK
jgi:hypothetical protein